MPEKREAPAEAPPERTDSDAVVDKWFADNFHGSIVARDADALNHVYHAAQKLKELLKK